MKQISNHGFIRVATAIPEVKVADCKFNAQKIIRMIHKAADEKVQVICFPELCISSYSCGDLFHNNLLLKESERALLDILQETKQLNIISIIGLPVLSENKLFNAAAIIQSGKILGVVPKTHLPNYCEFVEKRWFSSGEESSYDLIHICGQISPFSTKLLFGDNSCLFSVEICEDLWATIPPSSHHAIQGAHIIFNLSASNELVAKNDYREQLIKQQSARCYAAYVYASSGPGESTTDVVFSGNGIIAENGIILSESERFSFEEQLVINEIDIERLVHDRIKRASWKNSPENYKIIPVPFLEIENLKLHREVSPHPFLPPKDKYEKHCEEIFSIQIGGLAKRIKHTNVQNSVIGISGGLDSTLALLVCIKTYDKLKLPRKNIIGVTMPGYGTSLRTYNNAIQLMDLLGISIREINIKPACDQHFMDIGHDISIHDATYENAQARERMQILMDIANQTNGLVIGTGDMSELALGWTTYNGDHMSMYGINVGVPKTLVREIVHWFATTQTNKEIGKILSDIVETPVSPELLPTDQEGKITQKTENLVGPYELHDFFLYYMIRFGFSPEKIFFLTQHAFKEKYENSEIKKWMKIFFRRFFSQQFKRSCLPDGPKVGPVNLSPRGDWKMASDVSASSWLE